MQLKKKSKLNCYSNQYVYIYIYKNGLGLFYLN